ncbi:MAG TPA: histidinol-phosphate transaminase [Burkholderiales bacterium]|nr:histidinol-phosphate transaminase [Burkholderiales bacterium]
MAAKPEDVIRDEVRALAGYHVPDASGMVKLDAMENPYRLPEDVRRRLGELVANAEINRYPDASAAGLKKALRAALGVPADQEIILGNGSDEIIQMLVMATAKPGATVMSVAPTFVMFRLIAEYCRVGYASVPLNPDFSLDVERTLIALEEHKPALVFLAYPNNPTGNLFDDAAIEQVIRAAPGLVVVDEAYHAFAGRTFMRRLNEFDNLLVMRTLSKSGLAGLRLGLVAGGREWLQHVDKVRLPYNVGVLTQIVAEEALRHSDLLEQQAAAIRAERGRLADELAKVATTVYPSAANFILFRIEDADRINAGLKQRGILIKNLNGSHPSLADCLRVTVGTIEENDRFIKALKDAR